jgi:hypothetical protein
MMESEVIKHSQIITEKPPIQRVQNADSIRKKYKMALDDGRGREMKHEKSMSALNNFSKTEDAPHPHQIDAEMIRFRQKLKVNNERERRELSRELNFPLNCSSEKPAVKARQKKENIDEQMRKYEKRLNTYDSKKLLGLANEGQIERVPLGDRTNSSNSYLKYSPYTSKQQQPSSHFKLKIKQPEAFEASYDLEQADEPLTADFRQPSDKNELKMLLKSLSSQISFDE